MDIWFFGFSVFEFRCGGGDGGRDRKRQAHPWSSKAAKPADRGSCVLSKNVFSSSVLFSFGLALLFVSGFSFCSFGFSFVFASDGVLIVTLSVCSNGTVYLLI